MSFKNVPCLQSAIKLTSTYITAHLRHLKRVQSLGVAHVDPDRLLLVLHVGFFVFNLKHTTNPCRFYSDTRLASLLCVSF